MKLGLVAHGYPPELVGGTENNVQALARALSGLGHDVFVIAGSMDYADGWRRSLVEDRDPISGNTLRVHRIHRADLYFDHWHKSASPAAGQLFEEILREESPDVINVHHWIRLSRDLVTRAARLGIPSVVTLHDLWTTCLVAFRIRPDTQDFCDAPLAPDPCGDCASKVGPATPWVQVAETMSRVAEFKLDMSRELELAALIVVPCEVHAKATARFLATDLVFGNVHVLPPARTPHPLSVRRVSEPKGEFTKDEPLVLAYFGKWSVLKGTDLLLEALSLTREPERFRLLIAGDSPTPEHDGRLRAFVKSELPAGVVTFFGPYDHSRLSQHELSAAHLFVTGTRAHESFGLVVDEALELGMGCLLPNLGALGERGARVEWATVFESGDARDLARTLDQHADDPARVSALRDAAISAVRDGDFTARAPSLEVLAHKMEELLEKAIAGGLPALPLAKMRAIDWPTREVRLQDQNDAWDHTVSGL